MSTFAPIFSKPVPSDEDTTMASASGTSKGKAGASIEGVAPIRTSMLSSGGPKRDTGHLVDPNLQREELIRTSWVGRLRADVRRFFGWAFLNQLGWKNIDQRLLKMYLLKNIPSRF
jgi:hypothetical protein